MDLERLTANNCDKMARFIMPQVKLNSRHYDILQLNHLLRENGPF